MPETMPKNPIPLNGDFDQLQQIVKDSMQRAEPIIRDFFEQHKDKDFRDYPIDPMNLKTAMLEFTSHIARNPSRYVDLQMDYWKDFMAVWENSTRRFMGEDVIEPLYKADKNDRRFKSSQWQNSALFSFLEQSYVMNEKWMQKFLDEAEDLDPQNRRKLNFVAQQYMNAFAPSNSLFTNPEVIEETLNTKGENLLKGLKQFLNDFEKDGFKVKTTDYNAFEVGKNIAATSGHVIFENPLMQFIAYTPKNPEIFKTPVLIVPPWINKYYILDLGAKNSFIGWLVDQGHQVFTISWVNPDQSHASMGIESYMQEGILQAIKQVQEISGEDQIHAIGYCLGGTLLSTTMAYLKSIKKADCIKSATFLTTLLDFEKAGEMKLFIDAEQVPLMEKEMAEKGFLPASSLQRTFSMLRSNDLIWSFFVNNYLMGKDPFPFDLLYWNDDSTNMARDMHGFCLNQFYLQNHLKDKGGIHIFGTDIDLRTIDTSAYFLSTREDHIAPWEATYDGAHLFSGDVTFTLAASGHIAGVINPPAKNKYCYWTNKDLPTESQDWYDGAQYQEGSWWPHWQNWIEGQDSTKKTWIEPKNFKSKIIEPAPGRYVKVKAV